jgi:hypothetical protein
MNGAAVLGTASLAGGVATFTTNALTVGVHNIKAVYGGWAGNFASTSAILKQTVVKAATTTTLASSANPSTHGKPVIFTATVKGAPGQVHHFGTGGGHTQNQSRIRWERQQSDQHLGCVESGSPIDGLARQTSWPSHTKPAAMQPAFSSLARR